jgi:hypothetical protein
VRLGVHRSGRAEQLQGLVGHVAAEVAQHAAAGHGEAAGWRVLLHPRLERGHLAERARVQERADGAEIRVPAPVLVDGERDARPFGLLD